MARLEHHIQPDSTGGWKIIRSDTRESIGHFTTREEAIAIGEQISRREQSELVVYDAHGQREEGIASRSYPYNQPLRPAADDEEPKK